MADTTPKRKTQAQRRAQSRQAVLDSAVHLFGEKGYSDTSLEDIAAECELTIRPIYHYFGNKKALFAAVNEVMEERILASMKLGGNSGEGAGILANWRAYLDLCDDPAFRQIVLVDSPNILGRERWTTSAVTEKARASLDVGGSRSEKTSFRVGLMNRIVMGALTEAALMIAESEDISMAKEEAELVMVDFLAPLLKRRGLLA